MAAAVGYNPRKKVSSEAAAEKHPTSHVILPFFVSLSALSIVLSTGSKSFSQGIEYADPIGPGGADPL